MWSADYLENSALALYEDVLQKQLCKYKSTSPSAQCKIKLKRVEPLMHHYKGHFAVTMGIFDMLKWS